MKDARKELNYEAESRDQPKDGPKADWQTMEQEDPWVGELIQLRVTEVQHLNTPCLAYRLGVFPSQGGERGGLQEVEGRGIERTKI